MLTMMKGMKESYLTVNGGHCWECIYWVYKLIFPYEVPRYFLTIPPNVKYQERFLKAYREARENKKGLWR